MMVTTWVDWAVLTVAVVLAYPVMLVIGKALVVSVLWADARWAWFRTPSVHTDEVNSPGSRTL